jgi:hypothetical protein
MIEAVRAEGIETAQAFHFAGAIETIERLERLGFVDVRAWLVPETIAFDTDEALEEYLLTPYLRPATGLPDQELRRLAKAAAARLPTRAIEYVRLNVLARRGWSAPVTPAPTAPDAASSDPDAPVRELRLRFRCDGPSVLRLDEPPGQGMARPTPTDALKPMEAMWRS